MLTGYSMPKICLHAWAPSLHRLQKHVCRTQSAGEPLNALKVRECDPRRQVHLEQVRDTNLENPLEAGEDNLHEGSVRVSR